MRSAQLRLGDEPHVFIEHSSIHRRFLESTPQHRDGEALWQALGMRWCRFWGPPGSLRRSCGGFVLRRCDVAGR